MSRYISEDLKILVESRAEGICEYCLISITDTYFGAKSNISSASNTAEKQNLKISLWRVSRVIAAREVIWVRLLKDQND